MLWARRLPAAAAGPGVENWNWPMGVGSVVMTVRGTVVVAVSLTLAVRAMDGRLKDCKQV